MFYRSRAEAPRTISGIKLLIDGGGLSPTTVRLHGVARHVGGATRWHVFRLAAAFSMFANTHSTYTHTQRNTQILAMFCNGQLNDIICVTYKTKG